MKCVRLDNNIVKLSEIASITSYDEHGRIYPSDKGTYVIAIEMKEHEKYLKACYFSCIERDIVFDKLQKLLHAKEIKARKHE